MNSGGWKMLWLIHGERCSTVVGREPPSRVPHSIPVYRPLDSLLRLFGMQQHVVCECECVCERERWAVIPLRARVHACVMRSRHMLSAVCRYGKAEVTAQAQCKSCPSECTSLHFEYLEK